MAFLVTVAFFSLFYALFSYFMTMASLARFAESVDFKAVRHTSLYHGFRHRSVWPAGHEYSLHSASGVGCFPTALCESLFPPAAND